MCQTQTKDQRIQSLKEQFSNNSNLKKLLEDISDPEIRVKALQTLRREYLLVYQEWTYIISEDKMKSEDLIKQLISEN